MQEDAWVVEVQGRCLHDARFSSGRSVLIFTSRMIVWLNLAARPCFESRVCAKSIRVVMVGSSVKKLNLR